MAIVIVISMHIASILNEFLERKFFGFRSVSGSAKFTAMTTDMISRQLLESPVIRRNRNNSDERGRIHPKHAM